MQLKLSAKLYAATAGALILMLMLVGINAYSTRSSQAALAEVFEHTVKPLLAVQAIDRNLQEVRFRVAGVILDQLPRAGARIHLKEAREAIPQQWKAFTDSNRADNPDEIALIKKIESGLAATPALFDKIDKLYDADDRKALEAVIEDDWPQVTTQIVKPLGELIAMQTRQMGDTYEASRKHGEQLNGTVLTIFAVTVLLMLAGAWLVVRSITRPVREVERVLADVAGGNLTVRAEVMSRDEIGAMAASLNATVEALNATLTGVHRAADRLAGNADSLSGEAAMAREDTQMQTDNVMQVSAAMQQLTVSVAEISGRARDVADASAQTQQIARDSAEAVRQSTQTTGRALQAVSASSTAVGELSSEIEKISAITMVIKEIADQTNLLALNAAIEAARAGESGRGFAVVADEVRKLAERTTASTGDITRMIQAIQNKTQTAVGAMEAVSVDVRQGAEQTGQLDQSFAGILEAAERLHRLAGEIASGTNEQSQVAQQTARSMEGISQASERTGGRVSQVAATAAETAGTAQELKQLVDRFRVQ